jgi:hypothetical protein
LYKHTHDFESAFKRKCRKGSKMLLSKLGLNPQEMLDVCNAVSDYDDDIKLLLFGNPPYFFIPWSDYYIPKMRSLHAPVFHDEYNRTYHNAFGINTESVAGYDGIIDDGRVFFVSTTHTASDTPLLEMGDTVQVKPSNGLPLVHAAASINIICEEDHWKTMLVYLDRGVYGAKIA